MNGNGKPSVRQVIVVEGRYDRDAVLRAVDATVVTTGGFGVFRDGENVAYLRALARRWGVILLTDSDGAGFVIRGKLRGALGDVQLLQAYIPDAYGKERRKRAPSREGKLGVEAMSPQVLLEALRRAGATFDGEVSGRARGGITKADLCALGLSGGADSAERRRLLQRRLDLPERLSANGLLDALNALMTLEELVTVTKDMNAGGITDAGVLGET